MNEDKLENAINRSQRAERLLSDELLQEVCKGGEERMLEGLLNTVPQDSASREQIYLAVNARRKVLEELRIIVANGNLATVELNKRQKQTR